MLYLLIKSLALLSGFKDTYKGFYNLISGKNVMLDWKKKLKFAAIVSAFAVLILIVLTNIVNTTQMSEKDFKTYRQGLVYLKAKDYENAYFNFSNVSKNSAIYEIALLRQGLCADDLNDYETATKKYRMFIEKYPESMFIKKAYYALAQNYFRTKDYNKAEKTFNTIRKNFKDSEYKIASSYYLGMIYKEKAIEKNKEEQQKSEEEKGLKQIKDAKKEDIKESTSLDHFKQKAKVYFAEYLNEVPNGRLSMNCVNEIQNLKIPLTQRDYFLIGRTYYKNGAFKAAFDNFNKSYMSSSWGYLSEIYRKQGNYKKYQEIFEHNYTLYSKNIETDDLYVFLDNYTASYPKGQKSGWYNLLLMSHNSGAQGQDYIMYRLTKFEDFSVKNELYNKIYQKFPRGKFASDALANLFWEAYTKKRYKDAFSLGMIHIRDYPNTLAAPRVLFWMGKIAEMQGNKTEAKVYYQKVLDTYPDDYYAYRASKHLSYSYNTGWKTKSSHRLPEKDKIVKFPFKQTGISDDNLSLINAILKLNDYKLLAETEKENKAIQSWINYKEGKFSTSAHLARDAIAEAEKRPSLKNPDFSDSIYRLAYPLHFQETINNFSKEYRLDPYLVTALIREESYFNPNAGSSAGAMGLMQLMPATASYIANRNNINYRGKSTLFNPQKNIELGCAYLDYAKEKLYENDMLAVASYNGGPNAVLNWKDTLNYKNFDEFIEFIPYPETKDYVKKVYRSYWVYINIY